MREGVVVGWDRMTIPLDIQQQTWTQVTQTCLILLTETGKEFQQPQLMKAFLAKHYKVCHCQLNLNQVIINGVEPCTVPAN